MVQADRIVIYKSDPCPFCRAAIRYLREIKGEDIEIVDMTGDWDSRKRLVERSGQRTVPQIWVGDTHIGGFDDMRALDAAGKLDPLITAVHAARA
jgi:glutaredoxin 3